MGSGVWLTDVGAWWDVDLLGGNLAGMTLGHWALPAMVLQAVMNVDTGIFQKYVEAQETGKTLSVVV